MKKLLLVIGAGLVLGVVAVALLPREGPRPQSIGQSVFQTNLQAQYENLFEAALIVGARVPGGGAMPLDRLLALASRDGMQRLDDSSIGDLVRLRSQLAIRSDTGACAAIWSGASPALIGAIEKLPPEQQEQWASLYARAAQATIQRTPIRPAPAPQQYEAALDRALNGLQQSELGDIETALNQSWRLTPAQECRAARAFYRGLAQADPSDAITVARAMLYQ